MASSMVSRCVSDQNILLVAPSAATPRSLLAGERRRERAQPVDPHDLDLRPLLHRGAGGSVGSSIGAVLLGDVEDLVELLLEAPVRRRGRRAPLEAEGGHRHLPAVVHAADDVVLRAAGVGEEDLVELRRPVGLDDGADLDALLVHRHEQVGDAGVLGRVGVGAGEQEAVVGVLGLGGPDLLAVDDPLVAVELGLALQAGEVGAGVGLGEALAPRRLALEDAGEELLLLLLGPPLQDRRADEGVAEEVAAHRGADPGELLVEHHVLHGRQALAAVLLRPRRADPPALEELLVPLLGERGLLLGRHLAGRTSRRAGSPRARRGSRRGTSRPLRDRSGPCRQSWEPTRRGGQVQGDADARPRRPAMALTDVVTGESAAGPTSGSSSRPRSSTPTCAPVARAA